MLAKYLVNRASFLLVTLLALSIVGLIFVSINPPGPALAQPLNQKLAAPHSADDVSSSFTACLPIVMSGWPPTPDIPVLNSIDNGDEDNYYTVSWIWPEGANSFVLEEATNPAFSDAQVVFIGSSSSWTVPNPGKTPGTYYYRIKAQNQWTDSEWSSSQYVTIHPLFVGLQFRWDGQGYIRGDEYFDVGTHQTREFTGLTAPDTIRAHSYHWYDPNPQGWEDSEWDSYYSVSTGYLLASSVPSDPSWKWGHFSLLPYDIHFYDGQVVLIDGQKFHVSGPLSGYTAFGKPVEYWQLVNSEGFLYWDGGGDWTQRVHPGDVTLWYDAGATRLLLKSDVLRRFYYRGTLYNETVQYIQNLTYANSFPGMGNPRAGTFDPASPGSSEQGLNHTYPAEGVSPHNW